MRWFGAKDVYCPWQAEFNSSIPGTHRVEERITSPEQSSNTHVCMVELVSTHVPTYKYMYIFLQIKRYNAMFLNRKLIMYLNLILIVWSIESYIFVKFCKTVISFSQHTYHDYAVFWIASWTIYLDMNYISIVLLPFFLFLNIATLTISVFPFKKNFLERYIVCVCVYAHAHAHMCMHMSMPVYCPLYLLRQSHRDSLLVKAAGQPALGMDLSLSP